MLKFFIALLVVSTGVTATDEICNESLDRCKNGNPPDFSPRTIEEFKQTCNFAISYFECALDYAERCNGTEENKNKLRNYIDRGREICDEDGSLYTVVTQNLECYSIAINETTIVCREELDIIAIFAKFLRDEGLLTIPKDEFERNQIYVCLTELLEVSCLAPDITNKCGPVATTAYFNITQQLIEAIGCETSLPVLMHKVENNKPEYLFDLRMKMTNATDFYVCSESLDECKNGNLPNYFPQTAEEFNQSCEFATSYFECALDYPERCDGDKYHEKHIKQRKDLEVRRGVCDQNNQFDAVVQNLECYHQAIKKLDGACWPNSDMVYYFADSLKKDGFLTFSEEEFEGSPVENCMFDLLDVTCVALNFRDNCGTAAMDAYVEMSKQLNAMIGCKDPDTLLPELLRRYRGE